MFRISTDTVAGLLSEITTTSASPETGAAAAVIVKSATGAVVKDAPNASPSPLPVADRAVPATLT